MQTISIYVERVRAVKCLGFTKSLAQDYKENQII